MDNKPIYAIAVFTPLHISNAQSASPRSPEGGVLNAQMCKIQICFHTSNL